MSLITTVGGTDSNSYVTLDEYQAYAVLRGWTLTSGEPELFSASIVVDQKAFAGSKASDTQAMQWPRSDVVIDDVEIASDVIPDAVKRAQMELAYLIQGGFDPFAVQDTAAETRSKAGPVEVSKRYSVGTSKSKTAFIDALLRDYLGYSANSAFQSRLIRG